MMVETQQFSLEELKVIRDCMVCTIACLDREAESLRHEVGVVLRKVQAIVQDLEAGEKK